jgi:hypothetical protein
VRVAPVSRRSDGDLAAFLSASYGLTPDDWQSLVLDDWLSVRADGKWASLTCGLAVPRQNGKNGVIEMRELYGMVELGERFLHTAHEVKTARKAFLRLASFFENDREYPELAALVQDVRRTNGQEAIVLANGGSVEFVARSKGSGRGFTVDCLVMDEAQELSDDALEALMPTTSAAPTGNPQWVVTGTPPGPAANGEVFTRTRAEALSGRSTRLCWHEWSAVGDVDLDDRGLWHRTNPALGGRLQLDVCEGERARFSDEGFARERLGMWEGAGASTVVDAREWAGCADNVSVVEDPVAFAVDVAPMGRAASIGLAGRRADGKFHVEVVKNARGTEWLVPALETLRERWAPCAIVLDRVGPAAGVTLTLKERGFDLLLTNSTEMAQACGGFLAAVTAGDLRHGDQPLLNAALGAARKRAIGDGGWGWNRRDEGQDITPLVSVTLALWGFQQAAAKPRRKSSGPARVVVMA